MYPHKEIEKKWQEYWEKNQTFKASETDEKEKQYILDMFPYPSADGLHVGTPEGYTATDIYARYLRMKGYSVLHPMGWDAFGLPAENFAIKKGIHPNETTQKSIANFQKQIRSLGFSYDWSREIDTSSPQYYKWTQWLFLELYKKGLAYKAKASVNWCEHCQTVLANEQVIAGACERCKNQVIQKLLEQWFFKITDYVDELIKDLDDLDWPESIKASQRNWIGRSEGATITFAVKNTDIQIPVFTTRADTLFGVAALMLAPEHSALTTLEITNRDELNAYIEASKRKSDLERTHLSKDKTGVRIEGVMAINPGNHNEIPIFIADYILGSYGTGAVMSVPAHDERDNEFAKKYNLPVVEVIQPLVVQTTDVDAVRHDMPFSERNAVVCIVKHWSEEKYLGVEWGKAGWKGFVIGGIESNEEASLAGLREITEESGYLNVEYTGELGGIVHSQFYQSMKKENRFAHFTPLLFTLKNEDHQDTSEEEKKLHTFSWLTADEMDRFVTHPDMKIIWQRVRGNTCYTDEGILTNSGEFDGMTSKEASMTITKKVNGEMTTTYRLRDWLVSRQRYWGAPIPIIYCEKCGTVPVPEVDLPVVLPTDVDFRPTGESPLVRSETFHDVRCPKCENPARRESDTMDTFVCSSWYYLRFTSPHENNVAFDQSTVKHWMPVDLYVGGAENAVLHLMYARFITKALRDMNYLNFDEPFLKLRNQGMILGEDGQKMSKSKGNVINPDVVVEEYGGDTLRLYEMFMGPLQDTKPWNTKSIAGTRRFLDKTWSIYEKAIAQEIPENETNSEILRIVHKTIKKVTADIESMSFNTAISTMMICINTLHKEQVGGHILGRDILQSFAHLLSPFAPHFAEELWSMMGNTETITFTPWPMYDESLTKDETITLVVQVDGKTRTQIPASPDISKEEAQTLALTDEGVQKWIDNKEIKNIIYVPGRLINIVVE